MINGLRPYPTYKPTSLPWLGNVPRDWSIRRIKTLFSEKDDRNHDGERVLMSLTRRAGLIPQNEASNRIASVVDVSNYKVCDSGDIVMNRMQAWSGMFALANREGIVSPDYTILVSTPLANGKYFESLFKTPLMVAEFARSSKGIGSGFNRLYTPEFGVIGVPLPPLDEQAAIVKFLDYADSRLRRYIRAKQKLVKLLEEQKQAIIHQAVTRGLNPDAPMKDSGVDWLREIPAHWEVRPLKHWASINSHTLSEQTPNDFEFYYIDIGTVSTGQLVREPQKMRFASAPSRARRILRDGDTVLSTVRTYLKAIWFVKLDGEKIVASTGFAVLTPRNETYPEFFTYVVQSQNFIDRVTANSIGTSYPAINETRLASLHIAIPPTSSEQGEILKYIEEHTRNISASIETTQNEIVLLREYRTRLIADVVTGKLDVREAAAGLPDEIEDDEPLEGDDDLDEVDELQLEAVADGNRGEEEV